MDVNISQTGRPGTAKRPVPVLLRIGPRWELLVDYRIALSIWTFLGPEDFAESSRL
jgi:hypothetical protein